MATNVLKKIHARVKQLRKAHPKMKYQDLMKKAGKEISGVKSKKVSGVKKAAPKKKTIVKTERLTTIGKVAKRSTGDLSKFNQGKQVLKRIDQMEKELKNTRGKDARLFLKHAINKQHDKLDQIRKAL